MGLTLKAIVRRAAGNNRFLQPFLFFTVLYSTFKVLKVNYNDSVSR